MVSGHQQTASQCFVMSQLLTGRCGVNTQWSCQQVILSFNIIYSCCHTQSKMRPFLFLFISTFLICWTGRIFQFLCSMLLSMKSIIYQSIIYIKSYKSAIYTQKVYCKLFRTRLMPRFHCCQERSYSWIRSRGETSSIIFRRADAWRGGR